MYRVEFRNMGLERRCWTVYLPEYTGSTMIRHLERRGVFLAWESEEPFGQPSPMDDVPGGVEGVISNRGQKVGSFKAYPMTKEQAAAVKLLPDSDPSDSFLCDEPASHGFTPINTDEAALASSEIPF